MNSTKIYSDIATRTNGDIYIGVVGPVRSGKSTFIKRFMEELVLPAIDNEAERARARDEIPQSANGKTVMTTEPKFVPEKAVRITLQEKIGLNVKMIDCVGYIVDGAAGLTENGEDRMVMTPWSSTPMPFGKAAETGTKKVIDEHSTIGIIVTTDGTVSELPRTAYEESESRVITDMKASGKPFVIVVNSAAPESEYAVETASELEKKHGVPVALINCEEMDVDDIENILELCLTEFPVTELRIAYPLWLDSPDCCSETREEIEVAITNAAESATTIASVCRMANEIGNACGIENAVIDDTDLGTGASRVRISIDKALFYKAVSKTCGEEISDERALLDTMARMSADCRKFEKFKQALDGVESTGYGIVVPQVDDLILEEPEIIKQSGGYGVKLKACADSIHMIKAKIKTEINPIVGSEKQSEEMVKFLLKEFEENPRDLWESNMFGKSLYCLVNEGLNAKLDHMPADARAKIGQTLQKIVNEGSNGLICIIL